ncbi:MAG: GNAT family N-acetyltransferase [Bacteroidetes bacterium]|nr:GNAT family N-acetyltransferase [Bacteroidota bacterium]MBS1756373.1 GNAT family N-acetyltransferase [Bacteroidota bacterium]
MAEILQTQRLYLREFTNNDAAFIVTLLNSATFLKFIGDKKVRTLSEAENYLTNGPIKSYAENGFGLWLYGLKETNKPIGMCGLIKRDTLADIDIGYAMLPAYENKGYALEISEATLNYGKTKLGINRIIAITSKENIRSARLLNKIGLHFEKNIQLGEGKEELMLFG